MKQRRRRALLLGIPLLVWGGVLGACGTSNDVVARGGECFYATDCQPGLVCVQQKNGARICTDDLSGVGGDPPPEPEGDGAADEGGDGGEVDGPPPNDSGTDQTVTDTGQDTSPPMDAGSDG